MESDSATGRIFILIDCLDIDSFDWTSSTFASTEAILYEMFDCECGKLKEMACLKFGRGDQSFETVQPRAVNTQLTQVESLSK